MIIKSTEKQCEFVETMDRLQKNQYLINLNWDKDAFSKTQKMDGALMKFLCILNLYMELDNDNWFYYYSASATEWIEYSKQ